MKDIQGDMKYKYGSSEKFAREDIAILHDNGDPAKRQKFGKIKIYLLNSHNVIKIQFYAASDSSIIVLTEDYRSTSENPYLRRKQ